MEYQGNVLLCVVILYNSADIVNIDPEKKEKLTTLLIACCQNLTNAEMLLAIVSKEEILYTTGYNVKNLG